MSTPKRAIRRSARRIGADKGADYEERRRIILREAAKAFNEKGVQYTSIDDVAQRLGVTKPAVYHYVPSKDALILQCLQMAVDEIGALLDQAAAMDGPGVDKLRFLLRHWAEFAVTDFGRAIVLIESHSLGDESRHKHLDAHRTLLHRLELLVKEGIRDGSLRPCNPVVVSLALVAIFNSPARWYRAEGPLILDQVIDELLDLVEKGVFSDDA